MCSYYPGIKLVSAVWIKNWLSGADRRSYKRVAKGLCVTRDKG